MTVGTKFKLKVAIFWAKVTQKEYFQSQIEKVNINTYFCLFE